MSRLRAHGSSRNFSRMAWHMQWSDGGIPGSGICSVFPEGDSHSLTWIYGNQRSRARFCVAMWQSGSGSDAAARVGGAHSLPASSSANVHDGEAAEVLLGLDVGAVGEQGRAARRIDAEHGGFVVQASGEDENSGGLPLPSVLWQPWTPRGDLRP
jgi:hypothetical protein